MDLALPTLCVATEFRLYHYPFSINGTRRAVVEGPKRIIFYVLGSLLIVCIG